MTHLLITQPYLPAYRIPLFEAIRAELALEDVTMTVAVGSASGAQALRADEADASWSVRYSSSIYRVLGRNIDWRRMPHGLPRPDVIVSELQAINQFAWQSSFRSTPLVLWGHGKAYVDPASGLGDRLEWALARRATHLMTYTEGGRRYLIDKGRFDGAKVTAIGNSTDTEPIRTGFLAAVRDQRPHRSPSDEPRALYVGGLDPSKKIHFLIEAAREAARISPNFKLIVVGKGILSADVDEAIAQGVPIDRILEARGEGLGQLGSIADVMWMPGRVGLAAVDAVAMGLPVHTTPFPFHAPEIELLTDDEVAFLPENSREFAARSIALMAALPSPEDRKLRQDVPTVTSVAKAFSGVVRSALTERG